MKARMCIAVLSLAVGAALAQQNQSAPATQAGKDSAAQASKDSTTQATKDSTTQAGKDKSATQSGSVSEMKTRTYKGVLMDASCAGASGGGASATAGNTGAAATPGTPSNPGTPATPGSETRSASNTAGTANRSTGDTSASSGSCSVSSGTTNFAMKLDDGRTLPFDMVGNQRAKDQIQKNKKWSEAASSSKPIHARVSGVESGDKLVVSSIH